MANEINAQRVANHLVDLGVNVAFWGAAGYLGALLVQLNPPTGLVFGAVSAVVSRVAEPMIQQLFLQPGANQNLRALGHILRYVVPIAASMAFCATAGFPITLMQFAALSIASFIGALITQMAFELLGFNTRVV